MILPPFLVTHLEFRERASEEREGGKERETVEREKGR